MSAYPSPIYHNGELNRVYNPSDYSSSTEAANFLKLTGGTLTGDLTVHGDMVVTDVDASNLSVNKINPTYTTVPNLTGCIGDIISQNNIVNAPASVTNAIQTYRTLTLTKGRYLIEVEFALVAGATAGQFEFFLTSTSSGNNIFGSSSNQYSGTYETFYKFYNFSVNATTDYYLRAVKASGTTANLWYIEIKAYRIG